MENALRVTLIFVWCMFFGFFSIIGYLDETMATQKKIFILVGLIIILTVYLAFEWITGQKDPQPAQDIPVTKEEQYQANVDERTLRRIREYTQVSEESATIKKAKPPSKRKKSPVPGASKTS